MPEVHNLDEVREYFEFILFGKKYTFRHLTTHEMVDMANLKDKIEADSFVFFDYLDQFIQPIDKDAPAFKDVAKKMTIPMMKRFNEMIHKEFVGS